MVFQPIRWREERRISACGFWCRLTDYGLIDFGPTAYGQIQQRENNSLYAAGAWCWRIMVSPG
jgi:hypothetical protein